MVVAWVYSKRHGEDKARLQENYETIRAQGFGRLLRESSWALLTPVIILGSIYGGIASPTEAAGISIFYALFVSLFIYKSMTWRDLLPMLREGVKTYAAIIFIIATATTFGRVVSFYRCPAPSARGALAGERQGGRAADHQRDPAGGGHADGPAGVHYDSDADPAAAGADGGDQPHPPGHPDGLQPGRGLCDPRPWA